MTTLSSEYRNASVSSGTMRPADLIPCFLSFLEEHNPELASKLASDYGAYQDAFDYESEDADWLLDELFCALNDLAPEGCSFGSHPGDGADYGFWHDDDQESDHPTDGRDFGFLHGLGGDENDDTPDD